MLRRLTLVDPALAGAACGLLAAVAYTASNVFLRQVADCDPIWVSCVKSWPTIVLVAPFLVMRGVQGKGFVPSLRALELLMLAGLVGQLVGNVAFQWSLGVVGMSLSVALCFGGMILSGVLLGRWLLGESVTFRMLLASAVLMAAIGILSLGAAAANRAVTESSPGLTSVHGWMLIVGILAPCASGFAYSLLGVAIRHSAIQGTPMSMILMSVGLVGAVSLGTLSLLRLGPQTLSLTSADDLNSMLLAGACNAGAFWALSKALHLTNVAVVNGMNASQIAMAALAGVFFFQEAASPALITGVGLTVAGLILMKKEMLPVEA